MIINFQKYQGAGNDFIIIDNRTTLYDFPPQIVERLCHRKFGIGADGLMLLEDCRGYDFRMRYFNADGYEASLCGNGSRCIVDFARQLGLFSLSAFFIASDGVHEGEITPKGIRVKMQDVQGITIGKDFYFLNTGSPHYVKLVEDAFQIDVFNAGRTIRYSSSFQPEGTNVNFITPASACIRVATYERGVENETLACGTGCVASALTVAFIENTSSGTYRMETKGGILDVSFRRTAKDIFTDIWLEGPAEKVFSGEIEIPAHSLG